MLIYTREHIESVLRKNLIEFNNELYKELIESKELESYLATTSHKAFKDLEKLIEAGSHEFSAWEIIREPILFK